MRVSFVLRLTSAMRAEVAQFSPEDVPGYERFMERSAAICRIGFEELGHVAFSSVRDMLRITPSLLRLGGHRSVYDLVARYIRDERLRTIFSFHPLLIGGSPFRASAIYCLIAHLERRWGVHFAMGGTGRLVDGLVKLIEGQGGTLRCRADVARIDVAAGVVEQLSRLGVSLREWVRGCTLEDEDLFSYRRDGSTGRLAGAVRLVPPTSGGLS